ncbi:hypothetical protein SpCBS45565_g03786 [Spizellomyces sp. 'palustris']|nr:hypothetical protein SpCBS45565_g03786 [Spizellomyces sp. 'palustris']
MRPLPPYPPPPPPPPPHYPQGYAQYRPHPLMSTHHHSAPIPPPPPHAHHHPHMHPYPMPILHGQYPPHPQQPQQPQHYVHYPQGSSIPQPRPISRPPQPPPQSNPPPPSLHHHHHQPPEQAPPLPQQQAAPQQQQQQQQGQGQGQQQQQQQQQQGQSCAATGTAQQPEQQIHAHDTVHHKTRQPPPPPVSPTSANPSLLADPNSPTPPQDNDDADPSSGACSSTALTATTTTTTSSSGVPDFVKKLFRMLEDTSYADIVSWGVHGDTFVVKEPNEFAKNVLPKHFKHNNPASFVRQLNKYGFHKIKSQDDGRLYGDQAWEFQHPNFQYNKKEMLESIRRKTPASKPKTVATTANGPAAPMDALTTELRKDTNDLQTQVDSLTKLQSDIASYLQGLSRNYRMVVEEILNFRKNMVAQDQVIRNLVDYIVGKDSGNEKFQLPNASRMGLPSASAEAPSVADESSPFITPFAFTKTSIPSSSPLSQAFNGLQPDLNMNTIMNPSALDLPKEQAQKLLTTYQQVARASFHQMNEISRHVREAYGMMQTPPPGLSPTPTDNVSMDARSGEGFMPNGDSVSGPSSSSTTSSTASSSASAGLSASAAFASQLNTQLMQTQQQGGLTVFTVGGFAPRRDDGVDEGDSSGSGTGGSPRPPNSMRVTRATFVPPWSVPPKVLLVEDDVTCRKLSSKLLQVFGCSFDVAVDGLDAVERMNVGNKYDIVLMDIVMPNLDGVTATNRIRQFDQLTPIISMTSNTTENDCMTYLANGMNDILAKPFNKHSMLSMIERYCNHLVGQRAAALGIPPAIAHRRLLQSEPSRIEEVTEDEPMDLKDPLFSESNFTDLLNMPMGELGGLGIQPFQYLSPLDLDSFEGLNAPASDSESSLSGSPMERAEMEELGYEFSGRKREACELGLAIGMGVKRRRA